DVCSSDLALYSQVFRDGHPLESPGYNAGWVSGVSATAGLLKKKGVDLYTVPRFRQLLETPIRSVLIGKFTPAVGDGSNVLGDITGRSVETYQAAYHQYKDDRYISWLPWSEEAVIASFDSFFRPAAPAAPAREDGRQVSPVPSRLFAGYGLGVLNDADDRTAVAVKYGMYYSHYHWDFLHVELMANGQKMMPDLGYPDAMNAYVKELYTWASKTIAPNTVAVYASTLRA